MPVDNIININSDYYIAMYSAHASIIEKLVGENGMLRSLRVDGGGLKAPKGSYKDRSIFDNYLPETRKTLHAKIIYLDRPKILSLWTGNLRKITLYDQENIIVTQRLTHRAGSKVKRWFANHNQNKHLIIHVLKNGTAKVHSSGDSIWKNCQSSLENLECNLEDKLSLHAFSPWGSGHFVKNIIKELNVKLIGHYRYYGVTWNFRKITTFLHRVQQFLFKAMNRRGCRRAYTWNGFVEMLKYYPLAKPKTYYCLY